MSYWYLHFAGFRLQKETVDVFLFSESEPHRKKPKNKNPISDVAMQRPQINDPKKKDG